MHQLTINGARSVSERSTGGLIVQDLYSGRYVDVVFSQTKNAIGKAETKISMRLQFDVSNVKRKCVN